MDGHVRYRAVLADPEFRAIYLAQALSLMGDQLARIALAILVYDRTSSPFEASATYAVSYLAYLVGGPLLSGLADRYPRLAVMVACDLVRAPLVLALCVDGLPLWCLYVVIGCLGAAAAPFDSARSAVQPDVLTGEAYVVGNALMNVTIQVSQIFGFVLGGAIVAATSVRGALALDAATFLVSAGLLLRGLRTRPAAQAPDQREGLLRDAARGLELVAGSSRLRVLLLFAILASVAVTSTEGLAVPAATELEGGPVAAGILTAGIPAGFLLASFLVLRTPHERRELLLPWLVLLSAAPLLLSPLAETVPVLLTLWMLAGAGATANLIAAPAFVQTCPAAFRGRAYGVAAACMWAAQGAGLLIAGYIGSHVSPRTAVAVVASATLLIAVPLVVPQGIGRSVRHTT